MWLFDLFWTEICKSNVSRYSISIYLRESLGLWDNERLLYFFDEK